MNRTDILDAARQAITVDRAATHGEAENTFGLIAAYWSAHLDHPVTAYDVGCMMGLFKLARMAGNPSHTDSAVDACGYIAIAGEMGAAVEAPNEWTDEAVNAMVDRHAKPMRGECDV